MCMIIEHENDSILLTKGEGVFQLLGLEAEQVRILDGGWWMPPTWHHTIPLGGGWRDGGLWGVGEWRLMLGMMGVTIFPER